MRMVSTLYSFQIVIVVSMVWRPIHAVIQISCGSTINLNPSSALTYRFGDGINPYQTLLNCDISFSLSDASEQILYQIFPDCEQDADVLKINDGANLCCFGCNRPFSALISSFRVSLTADSTTDPKELGFEIKIVTGKDESNCTASNPSSNISVSVGASPVIITSPNFPNQYPNNTDCSYIITPQDSSKGLSLTFDFISLDYDQKCNDYIELGIYNKEPYMSICTNYKGGLFLTNERYTSGGETYLHFHSDSEYVGNGFRVRIIQVDLGATQPPTAVSTTAVQTVETTTLETTAASTTAAQTAETTTPSATVGTTAETTVKLTTSETTPTSETTAVPATVQSVSSTITASTAESTAVESTATPHTDPTTKTIESNETTQDSTTATSSTSVSSTELPPTTTTSLTSITTKPEVTVSSTELPPTTPFPKTTTTGFFGALTTPATVVALTGLVFLGVVPCFAIVIFCLRKKRKRPSRDNQSQYPYLKRDAHYYNTYHYPMTHKPLFYQYWGEY